MSGVVKPRVNAIFFLFLDQKWPQNEQGGRMRAKAPCAAIFDFWDDPCGYNYLLNKERTLIQLIRAGGDLGPDAISRGDLAILRDFRSPRDISSGLRSPPAVISCMSVRYLFRR